MKNKEGLEEALTLIPQLRERFWNEVSVPGSATGMNPSLEKAGRVADFLEFGEMFALDALNRDESAGGHFRLEHQSEGGEAKRDDENFQHVSAWEYKGEGVPPEMHKESLAFNYVKPSQRSYK